MLYERRGCLFFVFSHIRQLKIKLNECELNPYVVSLAIKRSCSRKLWIDPLIVHHPNRLYLRLLFISQPSLVDMLRIITSAKTGLVFRKNLIKIFIHLVINTSFIDLRERRKNTDEFTSA